MNNPDRQLDRSLEEYLRSFVAEDIVLQEAIKRLEQGMIPADFDRRVNDKGQHSKPSNPNQRGRRAAGFQLESATAGIDGLSVGFAVRLHGPSSVSRLPSTTHRNSRFLSAGRSRRNISAAKTTAFTSSNPPMIANIDISPLMPRRVQPLISARRNHTRLNCSYGASQSVFSRT